MKPTIKLATGPENKTQSFSPMASLHSQQYLFHFSKKEKTRKHDNEKEV